MTSFRPTSSHQVYAQWVIRPYCSHLQVPHWQLLQQLVLSQMVLVCQPQLIFPKLLMWVDIDCFFFATNFPIATILFFFPDRQSRQMMQNLRCRQLAMTWSILKRAKKTLGRVTRCLLKKKKLQKMLYLEVLWSTSKSSLNTCPALS